MRRVAVAAACGGGGSRAAAAAVSSSSSSAGGGGGGGGGGEKRICFFFARPRTQKPAMAELLKQITSIYYKRRDAYNLPCLATLVVFLVNLNSWLPRILDSIEHRHALAVILCDSAFDTCLCLYRCSYATKQ